MSVAYLCSFSFTKKTRAQYVIINGIGSNEMDRQFRTSLQCSIAFFKI